MTNKGRGPELHDVPAERSLSNGPISILITTQYRMQLLQRGTPKFSCGMMLLLEQVVIVNNRPKSM